MLSTQWEEDKQTPCPSGASRPPEISGGRGLCQTGPHGPCAAHIGATVSIHAEAGRSNTCLSGVARVIIWV